MSANVYEKLSELVSLMNAYSMAHDNNPVSAVRIITVTVMYMMRVLCNYCSCNIIDERMCIINPCG